jgi:hypothetical protein
VAEKGLIITGARARLSIEGVKVGFATDVNLGEEIQYEEANVLDNIEVEEYVPVGYRVTFTSRKFRIVGETLKSRGWFPSLGSNTEEHLQNILTTGELSATLEDTKTGKLLATVEQVKIASHNYAINARGIVGQDVTFNAIRLKDESEV